MTIRIEAIAMILAATALTVADQGEKGDLVAEVIPEKPTVRLGDPIVVSVRVTNQAPEDAEASRSATAFDCFGVTFLTREALSTCGAQKQIAININTTEPGAGEFAQDRWRPGQPVAHLTWPFVSSKPVPSRPLPIS
jgi:hypothetical protein